MPAPLNPAYRQTLQRVYSKAGRSKKRPYPQTISERETGMTPEQLAQKQADLKSAMYARLGLV